MGIPIEALILAGFALAHASWSISDVEPGELLIPLAVIETQGQRQLVRFEANSQEEAIARGKRAMTDAEETSDAWAFAREGLMTIGDKREDVLVVEFWARGMAQSAILYQRFRPVGSSQSFLLIGDPEVAIAGQVLDSASARPFLDNVLAGVRSHSKVAPLWDGWH